MELIGLDPIGEGKRILQEKRIEWTNNQLTARKYRLKVRGGR